MWKEDASGRWRNDHFRVGYGADTASYTTGTLVMPETGNLPHYSIQPIRRVKMETQRLIKRGRDLFRYGHHLRHRPDPRLYDPPQPTTGERDDSEADCFVLFSASYPTD